MDRIVYTGPEYSIKILQQRLGNMFKIVCVEPTPEDLLPEFEKCTVFLDASMKVPIDDISISKATKLKLVITATTGANHIDGLALEQRNVPLLTLKGQMELLHSLTPAAELNWSLIMACARKLRGAFHHVENSSWERVEFPGVLLKDRTIGIIGMGRLGGWTARYANAFGMRILGYDPYNNEFPKYVERASLEEIMKESDVVSIHVHLSDETTGMISKELINKVKTGAIFVNTSRGELTDESALVEALKSGQLSSVGVDVLSGEPDIEKSPLWKYSKKNNNVIITPHIGGFCPDAVNKVVDFSCSRILDFFNNK
jgi:D-3-phosphoglycerate dehydrogenase